MSKKSIFIIVLALGIIQGVNAQLPEEPANDKGFKKEKLFTGGSIALSFGNNSFLVGASPVLGYNLTNWADAGVLVNYNYTRYRDVMQFNDKLKMSQYGAGAFVKLYPLKFLFAQAQFENNFIRAKYVEPGGLITDKSSVNVNSFLIGGGYSGGRIPGAGNAFYYLSVLFDVSGNINSPYTDAYGRKTPVLSGGFQIPLFQKNNQNRGGNNDYEMRDGRRRPRNYGW